MISKETLLSSCKRKIEKVNVPLDGGHVFVRSMTAKERDDYELASLETGNNNSSRVMMLLHTVCDKDGELIFSEDDIALIGEMDGAIVQPIYNKAVDLAYITKEDIEELEKN